MKKLLVFLMNERNPVNFFIVKPIVSIVLIVVGVLIALGTERWDRQQKAFRIYSDGHQEILGNILRAEKAIDFYVRKNKLLQEVLYPPGLTYDHYKQDRKGQYFNLITSFEHIELAHFDFELINDNPSSLSDRMGNFRSQYRRLHRYRDRVNLANLSMLEFAREVTEKRSDRFSWYPLTEWNRYNDEAIEYMLRDSAYLKNVKFYQLRLQKHTRVTLEYRQIAIDIYNGLSKDFGKEKYSESRFQFDDGRVDKLVGIYELIAIGQSKIKDSEPGIIKIMIRGPAAAKELQMQYRNTSTPTFLYNLKKNQFLSSNGIFYKYQDHPIDGILLEASNGRLYKKVDALLPDQPN